MIKLAAIISSLLIAAAAWADDLPRWAGDSPREDTSITSPRILGVRIYVDETNPTLIFNWRHVPGAVAYSVWREILVSHRLNRDGDLVPLSNPTREFIPWTRVEVAGQIDESAGSNPTVSLPVQPLDNVVTRWAIATEIERDGAFYRSSLRVFELPSLPLPTAVGVESWGRIKSGI